MERCPLCNARFKGDSACPRCRAVSLAPLLALESQSRRPLPTGRQGRWGREPTRARKLALQAMSCQATPFALALAGFLSSEEKFDA